MAATRRLEQLEQRIERMTLTSQITGTITSIFRHPGEVVAAGEPILEVTEQYTTEVHAFLQPAVVLHVEQGQSAQLVRQNGEILTGLVVSAGTGPKQMPAILWTNAAAPQWGVPVRIQIQEGQLPSGEPVQVMI